MNILKNEKYVYAIASIIARKNLVEQSIPIIAKRFILVILSVIILIENQVCITPKILYIH